MVAQKMGERAKAKAMRMGARRGAGGKAVTGAVTVAQSMGEREMARRMGAGREGRLAWAPGCREGLERRHRAEWDQP